MQPSSSACNRDEVGPYWLNMGMHFVTTSIGALSYARSDRNEGPELTRTDRLMRLTKYHLASYSRKGGH